MECVLRELRDEDLPALFERGVPRRRSDPTDAARIAPDNVASKRVLEKWGFRVVGTDRGLAESRAAEIDELVLLLED